MLRLILLLALLLPPAAARAELRGHGGPVRAIAVSPDGRTAVSGSFDSSIIVWSLADNSAVRVLRFHEGGVNALAMLPDGRFLSGGEDGKVALWDGRSAEPLRVFDAHKAPVTALAAAPDGSSFASGDRDGKINLQIRDFAIRIGLLPQTDQVTALAFSGGSAFLISAGHGAKLRVLPMHGAMNAAIIPAAPSAALAAAPDGDIIAGGSDGSVQIFDSQGAPRAAIDALEGPVTSLALSPDGKTIVVGGPAGALAGFARGGERVFARTLRGVPLWGLAYTTDGKNILAAGGDGGIHKLDAATGTEIEAGSAAAADTIPPGLAATRGAGIFRACSACHTLGADGGNRAGPSLHGLFGRRIASLDGYSFSPALKVMDIVWTRETVAKLFEVGPMVYTPGTKMPDQIIGRAEDRAALVEFLETAGRASR